MSELTEAEKRQRLRERRNKKLRDGASRLGKITGDYSEAKKEAEAIKTSAGEPSEKVEASTAPSTRSSGRSSSAATNPNRISQAFDVDDPEVEDISAFEPIQELPKRQQQPHIPSTAGSTSTTSASEAEDFERMLQQMLSSQSHQHGNSSTGASPDFDIFSKLLQGDTSGNPFGQTPPPGSVNPEMDPSVNEYEKKLAEYNKSVNDRFKAKFMVIKFIICTMLTIYFFHFQGFYSSSYEIYRVHKFNSGFTKVWFTLEIVFTSFYALHLNKIDDHHYNYNSKILKLLDYVPDIILGPYYKNKVRWFVKYQELINLIIFDLSVIIFFYGILSFLHGEHRI